MYRSFNNTNEMGGAYNTFLNIRLCHKLSTGNCVVQEQLVCGCGYGHVLRDSGLRLWLLVQDK